MSLLPPDNFDDGIPVEPADDTAEADNEPQQSWD